MEWKAAQRLGMKVLRLSRGVEIAVGYAIVHRGEAGRIQVAEPCNLYGRGLQGEHRQSIPLRVPGQIDEDIDPALANRLGERLVAHVRDALPNIGAAF